MGIWMVLDPVVAYFLNPLFLFLLSGNSLRLFSFCQSRCVRIELRSKT